MGATSVDYKKTVNLPRTDFPMKANLPQMEPKLLARWEAENLYAKVRAARAGRPMYVLHDGPPYANGEIHLGTGFNKIIKDFVVKTKTMQGYDSPYVPGWDCHGLPIEAKVDSQLGSRKAHMTAVEIRAECRKYAAKYVDLQRRDFVRLGVFGRWQDPYLTMSPQYESIIAGAFVEFLDRGYIYKGLKSVNWCIHHRTALAEAEIEYENHSSPSIWVRFALTSDPALIDPALTGRRIYGLIWTTTPWTIPANVAIAFHPKFEYVAVEVNGDVYIVALELLKTVGEKLGWSEPKVIAGFPGSKLEGAIFRHPFIERDSLGVLGEHVTLEQGTGAVHTAPGHGAEDFEVGAKYGLSVYCPVDPAGKIFHAEGAAGRLPEELIGKTVWQANPIVNEILKSRGALLGEEKITHSYPHCWRCHNPTIFRATEQWFIGMDRNDLRARTLKAIQAVKWMPSWGDERMSNMIATRPDWCISRQRIWGVPIIVFYCENCQEPFTDRKVLDRVVALFAKETADAWYAHSAAELMGPGVECSRCGHKEFRKETDILDVWFDSGSSHLAVLTPENRLPWPANMYLEGGDQYRGWFHSSLLVGVGLKGEAPYRECATNGWTLDEQGRAMSKSQGIGIHPDQVIPKHGADVLRLWASSVDFSEDVRLSDTILARLSEAYRKFRNTFRWALGNLHDFDPAADSVSPGEMQEIDLWILSRTETLVSDCLASYQEFGFHKVYRAVYDFATTDLSAVYFDAAKDRLYTAAPRSRLRRSAQTAIYRILYALVRLIAPLLAFTTEEVWGYLRKPEGSPDSVHLALFPQPEELTSGFTTGQRGRLRNWDELIAVRDVVLKQLEVARQEKFIGAPLEARVRLKAGDKLYPLLDEYLNDLPGLFIVSQVALERASGDELSVEIERAQGEKCERCWKYTTDVGADPDFPTICAACRDAVKEILGE
ncbi:MAG TPA: isoleucine--tRNA ligase [Bryobacteraceae bacterium]|jgi:isoleucyl-tRNA synthetase|nr:isoleucine--tRNA ligase [Bryobacteraceae bacterium]